MATKEDRFNNQTVLKIVRTSEALVKAADRFFKQYGITTTQYDVLVIINYSEGEVSQSDLGANRVVSRSNITGIIDRLERLGYVAREGSAEDRRVKFIKITQKGKDLINKVEDKYFDNLKKVVRFLTTRDKNDLMEIASKIEKGLKELP